MVERCPWSLNTPEETLYHDTEWGVPCYDDTRLFEALILETAQAGLSWSTVLNKREGYRNCFANFDALAVSRFTDSQIAALLENPAIIRNKLKISSTITNAKAFLATQKKYGSFSTYIWAFVGGKPLINQWQKVEEVPANTPLSTAIAKDLKKHGFSFVGTTTIYAFMQATGMVNDHLVSCFRHQAVQE